MLTYTLYHVTNRAAADAILAGGFAPGKHVQMSNSPWKIGTKGNTAIRILIDIEEEFMSFLPDTPGLFHVHLDPQTLNEQAQLSIIDEEEMERLRREFGTPGTEKRE